MCDCFMSLGFGWLEIRCKTARPEGGPVLKVLARLLLIEPDVERNLPILLAFDRRGKFPPLGV